MTPNAEPTSRLPEPVTGNGSPPARPRTRSRPFASVIGDDTSILRSPSSGIDFRHEHLILLTAAWKYLPPPDRERRNPAKFHRWAGKGLSGIRLETIRIGGRRYTSIEALERFCDRLTYRDATTPPVAAGTAARPAPAGQGAFNRMQSLLTSGRRSKAGRAIRSNERHDKRCTHD